MTRRTPESVGTDGTPKRRKLTVENVGELKAVFENASPKRSPSSREAIAEVLPQIRDLQSKGYTISDICAMINDSGFDMSLSTLRSYLRQTGYRRNKPRNSTIAKDSKGSKPQAALAEPPQTDATGTGAARFSIEDDKKL